MSIIFSYVHGLKYSSVLYSEVIQILSTFKIGYVLFIIYDQYDANNNVFVNMTQITKVFVKRIQVYLTSHRPLSSAPCPVVTFAERSLSASVTSPPVLGHDFLGEFL